MRVLLALLLCVSFASASPSGELRQAMSHYEAREYESARRAAEAILLSGRGDEIEAALYLIVRVNLATGQAERAARGSDRLIAAFPDGPYAQFARFARAESAFLLLGLAAAHEDLKWCADSASDQRLKNRAAEILKAESSFVEGESLFPSRSGEHARESLGSEFRARVWLLLSFPDLEDPAPGQLESSFIFCAQHLDQYDVRVERVSSAYAAVQILDRAVQGDCDLIVFAGDEGSATSLALANGDHKFPILKITSTPRSVSSLSDGIVELLPSQEAQAAVAARYAAEELAITHGLLFTPSNDAGKAHRDGFQVGSDFGLILDADMSYPANANSVRRELYDLMSTPERLERGAELSKAVLSREERERLFGEGGGGDVSMPPLPTTGAGAEVFFFSLAGEQLNNYCSQLGNLPQGMTLFGNSAWLDERALITQAMITRGMYVVAPLSPYPWRHTELYLALDDREEFDLSAWQLLGADAADFVSAIFKRQAVSGADFVEAARSLGHFSGASVEVDVSPTGENRAARVLKFDGESLEVVK